VFVGIPQTLRVSRSTMEKFGFPPRRRFSFNGSSLTASLFFHWLAGRATEDPALRLRQRQHPRNGRAGVLEPADAEMIERFQNRAGGRRRAAQRILDGVRQRRQTTGWRPTTGLDRFRSVSPIASRSRQSRQSIFPFSAFSAG